MRALVVGAATREADHGFLARLAASCDAVFAADGGGAACLRAGISPRVVIGDMDSLAEDDARALRGTGARFVTVSAHKDVTDLDLALAEARDAGASEIWASGVLGARLDHSLATIGALMRHAEAQPRVLEPDLSAWVVSPSGSPRLTLYGEGSLVSLFALAGAATVSCEGLRYPLAQESLPPLDSRGLSNVLEAAQATVLVHAGMVLVLSILTNGIPPAWDQGFARSAE